MPHHRFALGEIVLCTEKRFSAAWKAPYAILACIASDAIDPLYRISSIHRHETKVVGEHELSRMPLPLRVSQGFDEPFSIEPSYLEAANLNVLPVELPLAPPHHRPRAGVRHV